MNVMWIKIAIIVAAFLAICYYCSKPMTKKTLPEIDYILVEKQKHKMTVYSQNIPLKTYDISLGFNPLGHKEKKGDGKTPEGIYKIINKNPKNGYHLSLRVSYPNEKDKKNAAKKGLSPGGDIMVHGIKNGFGWIKKLHTYKDWTLGCIAVTNSEIEEIYPSVVIGAKIEIVP